MLTVLFFLFLSAEVFRRNSALSHRSDVCPPNFRSLTPLGVQQRPNSCYRVIERDTWERVIGRCRDQVVSYLPDKVTYPTLDEWNMLLQGWIRKDEISSETVFWFPARRQSKGGPIYDHLSASARALNTTKLSKYTFAINSSQCVFMDTSNRSRPVLGTTDCDQQLPGLCLFNSNTTMDNTMSCDVCDPSLSGGCNMTSSVITKDLGLERYTCPVNWYTSLLVMSKKFCYSFNRLSSRDDQPQVEAECQKKKGLFASYPVKTESNPRSMTFCFHELGSQRVLGIEGFDLLGTQKNATRSFTTVCRINSPSSQTYKIDLSVRRKLAKKAVSNEDEEDVSKRNATEIGAMESGLNLGVQDEEDVLKKNSSNMDEGGGSGSSEMSESGSGPVPGFEDEDIPPTPYPPSGLNPELEFDEDVSTRSSSDMGQGVGGPTTGFWDETDVSERPSSETDGGVADFNTSFLRVEFVNRDSKQPHPNCTFAAGEIHVCDGSVHVRCYQNGVLMELEGVTKNQILHFTLNQEPNASEFSCEYWSDNNYRIVKSDPLRYEFKETYVLILRNEINESGIIDIIPSIVSSLSKKFCGEGREKLESCIHSFQNSWSENSTVFSKLFITDIGKPPPQSAGTTAIINHYQSLYSKVTETVDELGDIHGSILFELLSSVTCAEDTWIDLDRSLNVTFPETKIRGSSVVVKDSVLLKKTLHYKRTCGGIETEGAKWNEPVVVSEVIHSKDRDRKSKEEILMTKLLQEMLKEGTSTPNSSVVLDFLENYDPSLLPTVSIVHVLNKLEISATDDHKLGSELIIQVAKFGRSFDETDANRQEVINKVEELRTSLVKFIESSINSTKAVITDRIAVAMGKDTLNNSTKRFVVTMKNGAITEAEVVDEKNVPHRSALVFLPSGMVGEEPYSFRAYSDNSFFLPASEMTLRDPEDSPSQEDLVKYETKGMVMEVSSPSSEILEDQEGFIMVCFERDSCQPVEEILCAYWDSMRTTWRVGDEPSVEKRKGENVYDSCSFNRLGAFSRLVPQVELTRTDSTVLHYISLMGCSASIASLTLVIVVYTLSSKIRKSTGIRIIIFLSFSLLCTALFQILSFYSIPEPCQESSTLCKVLVPLVHYFVLNSFLWMLVEAYYQYDKFVNILPKYIPKFVLKASCFCWGCPLLPVAGGLMAEWYYPESYFSRTCFMSPWLFNIAFLPLWAISMVLNLVFYGLFLAKVVCRKSILPSTAKRNTWRKVCVSFFMFTVLGLSWIFGILSLTDGEKTPIFSYLFTITSSFQGVFIVFLTVMKDNCTRKVDVVVKNGITNRFGRVNPEGRNVTLSDFPADLVSMNTNFSETSFSTF